MSDHISGPRALAEPIADITDVYAFPSPERPGHLTLVLNTLPFAAPTAPFSDGLVYRFRLRPLGARQADGAAPFAALVSRIAPSRAARTWSVTTPPTPTESVRSSTTTRRTPRSRR